MALRMKNFNIFGLLKTTTFREGSQETNIEGGLLKKGRLGQFPDLTGGLARMRGWCF